MGKKRKHRPARPPQTSWDPLASWYDGWVGESGSKFHRHVAIPATLELLQPEAGEEILDLGAGQGVLCPYIVEAGGRYTGVEISKRLVKIARRRHGQQGKFIEGDVLGLEKIAGLNPGQFDAVVYLLSLQDIEPVAAAIGSASWALRAGGRLVILMTHPCFRIPRQSGWGWDENRKLRYRRIDSYLTSLPVPLKPFPGQAGGVTRSFHRPLEDYVNSLSAKGLFIDQIKELPTYKTDRGKQESRAINRSNREIPLFLGIRALKIAR